MHIPLLGEMTFPWVVYYNDKAPIEAFSPYNPLVFDSETHPPLAPLISEGKEILGYIDLGEAEEWRPWFDLVKNAQLLIHENAHWPGSWIIDIRNVYWKNLLLEQIIPQILDQGFSGLFYDQLDVVLALETNEPQKYQGMSAAAIDLVQSIRARFPGKKIMMNRAYEIINDVGPFIDYVLAESLYTDYNFEKKKYRVRSQEEYAWQLNYLNQGRKRYPHLVIFSLDYWNPQESAMYKKIYSIQRGNCIRPYVTTISLDTITPEP